jgi:hypothetical protein
MYLRQNGLVPRNGRKPTTSGIPCPENPINFVDFGTFDIALLTHYMRWVQNIRGRVPR